MKNRTLLFVSFILAGAVATAGAQAKGSDSAPQAELRKMLQEAFFAEEVTQDLTQAAASYEALVAAYAVQRRVAATALFRLAEVRRKQDRPQDAIAHYQQLLRDFPAEEPLARLSRENLVALGVEEGELANPPTVIDDEESREIARLRELMAKSPDLLRGPVKMEGEEVALTPLHRAAGSGQLRVIEFLLANGFPVDGGDAVSVTPLRLAAEAGQKAACELLLQHGAGIDSSNPLFGALRNGHLILANFLLEKGADPNQFDIDFMEVAREVAWGDGEGAFLAGWRPLHWAIWKKEKAIVDLLLEYKADVNATLGAGVTPLHLAAHYEDPDLLKRLIDRGANVASATETTTRRNYPQNQTRDTVIEGGVTALHVAVSRGHLKDVELLLDVGAPIDAVTEKGQMTPLFLATSLGARKEGAWAWISLMPTELSELSSLVRTLLEHGASPNLAASDGTTPLHNVCNLGLQEIAMLLLENGAEIDPRTDGGYTPLIMAAKSNVPVDLLIALVEKGASLDAVHASRWSALYYADLAARVPLMRRFRYGEWVKEENIKLCIPQILYANELAVRKADDDQPPSMADILLEWTGLPEGESTTQVPSDVPISFEPRWSEALVYRRTPDGAEVIQLDLEPGGPLPKLQWGDVIEVTTERWEEVSLRKGRLGTQVHWRIPDSFRTVLEGAQVRHVTVIMSGIEKQLTLRGRLHIYNPLTDEAPLLPLGPLIRLLGGGSGEYINAELAVHRRPDKGGGTITTQLGWSEAEKLVLMDGDRIEVTPLPSTSEEKELRISMVSRGLLFGRSYPSSVVTRDSGARSPLPRSARPGSASWEGYHDPPTLLQFLAWQYASFAPWELSGGVYPRDEASQALQEWLGDPHALADAIIRSATVEPRGILPYPDWSKLVIRRLNDNLWQETIPVDLAAAMRACNESTTEEEARAFDIQLQFGDLVELPVLEERPDEPWTGFQPAEICLFEKALARFVTYQEKDGEFRGVKLRWIPPVSIPTPAGLVPLPAEFPEFGKVTVPLASYLVASEEGGPDGIEAVMRKDAPVPARAYTWLQDGDRVISTTDSPRKSRVILPPGGFRSE